MLISDGVGPSKRAASINATGVLPIVDLTRAASATRLGVENDAFVGRIMKEREAKPETK